MENLKALKEKLARCDAERKDLELRNAELTDFMENASVPLHWVDGNGVILWANQAELDALGYAKEEYIGMSIRNFHMDCEAIEDILIRLSNNEMLIDYPSRLKCRDGRIKHVLISSNVYRKNGEFMHTRCFTRDISEYKQEEEGKWKLLVELEESEERLRMAVESTHIGTWDWNVITGELYWSDECKKIFGLSPDQQISLELFISCIHPEDSEKAQTDTKRALDPASAGHYDLIYRVRRFDDRSVRWIRAQGKVYFNKGRKAERFIGTILDITDHKLAMEKVARSEKLFRSIALNIPKSLIIVIDKDHRFIALEGDLMDKMGFDRKNFEGKLPTEVGPPERYEASRYLYERVMNGEKFSIERKAATGEDYMVHFVPLKNERDEVEAGLIIALDITDIKQAEERSAKLVAIVDSSDDAIISKSLEGVITSWNDAAERIFGYTADEMIGQQILKLIPPNRQEEEPMIISRIRKGERVEQFETKRMTKTGKLLDVSLTISPVKDTRGNIIGVSKIARNITEKKQAEQRKNDFIAMVSHELKTPLTSISSYVQVLASKAQKKDDEFTINALTRMEVQTKKMRTMVEDFLTMARMEEAKLRLNKEPFRLDRLIEETASDAQFVAVKHTILLKDCDAITLNADRDKIGQVLTNLLTNAVKYSPKGGAITIGCEKQDGKVRIYVRDQGMGISPADQQRLFERFYRVQNDSLKHVSGFGIGLYLVSEILRYHDSKIRVESQVGAGSTFYFTLETVD